MNFMKIKKIISDIGPFNNNDVNNKIFYVIKVLLKTFLVYFVSLIIGEAIVIGLHYPLGYDPFGNPIPFDIMLIVKYYGYIITIFLFILFIKKFDNIKLDEIGINKKIINFFKGIVIGLIALFSIVILLIILNQIKFAGINKNANYIMIILYLGGFLIQSTMEEVICRGYLLNKLNKKISLFLSIFISFLFFSVFHFFELFNDGLLLGIVGIVNLFLISMIWSFMVIKNKSLYGSIGFHFIWNFTLFNVIGLNMSGVDAKYSIFKFTSNNSFITGISYGIESSIVTTIILTILLFIIGKNYKSFIN